MAAGETNKTAGKMVKHSREFCQCKAVNSRLKKKRSKVLEFYQPYASRAKGWKRKYSPERKVAVAGSNSHCRRCFASVSRRGLAERIAVAGEGCWLSSEEGDTAGKETRREGGQPRLGFLPRYVSRRRRLEAGINPDSFESLE